MPVLFISDLHLHPSRPETTRLFGEFVSATARQARALYILGDLFDAWAGDDDLADSFNAAVCASLQALAHHGTAVFLIPGNRDFLLDGGFAAAAGVTLLADETVVDVAGEPTLLLHGDTLCSDDREYQAFRSTVRNAGWQQTFLAKPLAERKAEIEALRQRSETEKRGKTMALMDVNESAVQQAFAHHRVKRMIHGHTHRRARHTHRIAADVGERWVLGDWGDWGATGNALACDADGCRWLDFPAL